MCNRDIEYILRTHRTGTLETMRRIFAAISFIRIEKVISASQTCEISNFWRKKFITNKSFDGKITFMHHQTILNACTCIFGRVECFVIIFYIHFGPCTQRCKINNSNEFTFRPAFFFGSSFSYVVDRCIWPSLISFVQIYRSFNVTESFKLI